MRSNVSRKYLKKDCLLHDTAFMELLTAVALTIILIIWVVLINAPLLKIVSSGNLQKSYDAPWYSVGVHELLLYFDPLMAGLIIPLIIVSCLIMITYMNKSRKTAHRTVFSLNKFYLVNLNIGLSMWLLLIFAGYIARSRLWHLELPPGSLELFEVRKDNLWCPDTGAGAFCVISYFAGGIIIPALTSRDFFRSCGFKQYFIMMTSILLIYFVPVKIFLRLVFDIKYVLVTPWFNI